MNGSSMETNIATNIESDFGEDLATNSNKENVIANGSQSSQRHRFKVVKLVSSEPYLRGRWNCKDFINKDVDLTTPATTTTTANDATVAATQQQTPSAAVATSVTTTTTTTSGADSTTTPNGVAIDNKIEQAMDLVKSHLMFAVREEVDVLKERIKELESEIHILRAHATSDVLQLVLQQQSGQQMAPQERQREQQLE